MTNSLDTVHTKKFCMLSGRTCEGKCSLSRQVEGRFLYSVSQMGGLSILSGDGFSILSGQGEGYPFCQVLRKGSLFC